MKLQSLYESSLSDLNIDKFTDNLDEQYVENIKKVLDKLKAFNKITLQDVGEDDMFLHITNGLIDFDLSFRKDDSSDDFFPTAEIAVMVNSEYVFNFENIQESDTHLYSLLNFFSLDFDLGRSTDKAIEFLDIALEAASKFADWYFEISGEHGKKVLLTKTHADPETQTHKGDWYWIPYLGYFLANTTGRDLRVKEKTA